MVALSVVAVGGPALAILVWLGRAILREMKALEASRSGPGNVVSDPDFQGLQARVTSLEGKVEVLPKTWEEFRDITLRSEQRARTHERQSRRRAREELEAEQDVEGDGDEDGGGSEGARMYAMPSGMGVQPQSQPALDVAQRAWALKYGNR